MGHVSSVFFFPRTGGNNEDGPDYEFEGTLAQIGALFGGNLPHAYESFSSEDNRYKRGGNLYLSRNFFAHGTIAPGGRWWSSIANPFGIFLTMLLFKVTSRFGGWRSRLRSPHAIFERALLAGCFPLKFMFPLLFAFIFGDGSTRKNYECQATWRAQFRNNAMPGTPPVPIAAPGQPRLRFSYMSVFQAFGQGHIDILICIWRLAQQLGFRVSAIYAHQNGVNQAGQPLYAADFIIENAGECFDEGKE